MELWRTQRAELLSRAVGDRDPMSLSDDEVDELVAGAVQEAWRRRPRLLRKPAHPVADERNGVPRPVWPDEAIPGAWLGVADAEIERLFQSERGSRRGFLVVGVAVVLVVAGVVVLFSPDGGGAPASIVECRGFTAPPEEEQADGQDALVQTEIPLEVTDRDPIATCEALWRPGNFFAPEGETVDIPSLVLCNNNGSLVVIIGDEPTACSIQGLAMALDEDFDITGEAQLARVISDETIDRCLQPDEFAAIVEDIFDDLDADGWTVEIAPRNTSPGLEGDVPSPTIDTETEACSLPLIDEARKVVTVILLDPNG